MNTQKIQWRAISLFAGAGGCSLGFKKAGVDIIAAFENADAAIATYNMNFDSNICQNVDLESCNFLQLRNQLGLRCGELDLIIGGPLCQGFTTAGNRFWDDPRNKLVQNYAQALEVFYPRWFMMENVEGILTTASGTYVVECIKKMISLGYTVSLKKYICKNTLCRKEERESLLLEIGKVKNLSFQIQLEERLGRYIKTRLLPCGMQ